VATTLLHEAYESGMMDAPSSSCAVGKHEGLTIYVLIDNIKKDTLHMYIIQHKAVLSMPGGQILARSNPYTQRMNTWLG